MQQGFLVQSLSRPHDHDPKTTAIQSTLEKTQQTILDPAGTVVNAANM
jgi:hypothetical protein